MDRRLLSWARAGMCRRLGVPPLWLFTDSRRLPDPRPAVARLPRGLAGVVLRHDKDPGRAALGHDLAGICRARGLALVVAGDARLAAALHAGIHLRSGRWPGAQRRSRGLVTSSAHGVADLRRAHRAGAVLAFLSPAFPTMSHPDARVLGPLRWCRIACTSPLPVAALGGVDGDNILRLSPRFCRAVGAITALT